MRSVHSPYSRRVLAVLLVASGIGALMLVARITDVDARPRIHGTELTSGGDCDLPTPFLSCGSQEVRVGKRKSQSLAPRVYGDVTVKNGGTLTLEGGDYAFCQLRVARQGRLIFAAPSTVSIGGRVAFSNGARVSPGSDATACDLELGVRGDMVNVARRAQVSTRLCAPSAKLFVANGARLVGSFVASSVHKSKRVTVQDCPATTTTTVRGTTTTRPVTTTIPHGTTTTLPGATTTTVVGATTTTLPGATTTTIAGATTTTVAGGTTTTTLPGACDCCTATRLQFTTGAPQIGVAPGCGTVSPAVCVGGTAAGSPCTGNGDCAGGSCVGALDCGGLYFGGSGVAVPLPSVVPDQGASFTKIQGCANGSFTLAATSAAESGSNRNCTSAGVDNPEYPGKPGCLFGPPLPVPNANVSGTSTCVINRIVTSATGSGSCGGETSIDFDLSSDLYLTGDLLSGVSGIQPCPICQNGSCVGGPNDTMPCTPSTGNLGEAFPTTHDCPPPAGTFIGSLPIPFALTTGATTLTASDTDGAGAQTNVFCGFCRSTTPPNPFQNPAKACTSNADCTTAPFTACQQRNDGAFGNGLATTISATGSASACLADGAGHPATLVSTFCLPPSFNGLVDGAADLPGPGAVALIGTAQALP